MIIILNVKIKNKTLNNQPKYGEIKENFRNLIKLIILTLNINNLIKFK